MILEELIGAEFDLINIYFGRSLTYFPYSFITKVDHKKTGEIDFIKVDFDNDASLSFEARDLQEVKGNWEETNPNIEKYLTITIKLPLHS